MRFYAELLFNLQIKFHPQVIDYWTSRAKSAETEVQGNIMGYTVAMVRVFRFFFHFNFSHFIFSTKDVRDSLNEAFIAIEFTHVRPLVT